MVRERGLGLKVRGIQGWYAKFRVILYWREGKGGFRSGVR
jgi:hypothetical protein